MKWRVAVIGVTGCAAIACGAFIGCLEEPHRRTEAGGGNLGCFVPPGEVPSPDCDITITRDGERTFDCRPEPGCVVDESKCGSIRTCAPLASNAGKPTLDMRIRRLNVVAPPALADDAIIRGTVVTSNVNLNNVCAEDGTGQFNWLLRIDRPGRKVTTGGAPPPLDPFGEGFCFYRQTVNGIDVAPKTFDIDVDDTQGGFRFRTKPGAAERLYVPIFLDKLGDSVILLPLTKARFSEVTVTGTDCIGQYRPEALQGPKCYESPSVCPRWATGGALAGYVTIEDADQVMIRELNRSLCVLLTGSPVDESTRKCRRIDGRIPYPGDYCSRDETAGSCRDSFWLAATFAASAVRITEGGLTKCQGGSAGPADGGTDAPVDGSPVD